MLGTQDTRGCCLHRSRHIWLRKVRQQPRKILRYDKANWDNIRSDLEDNKHKQ